MEVSNDDIARILGRMEAKLDAQTQSVARLEGAIATVDLKLTQRLDKHESRLRELEIANPKALAETVAEHAERIQKLEKDAVKNAVKIGLVSGAGSAIGIGLIVEIVKAKLGLH